MDLEKILATIKPRNNIVEKQLNTKFENIYFHTSKTDQNDKKRK